jgi:hypothetical protein
VIVITDVPEISKAESLGRNLLETLLLVSLKLITARALGPVPGTGGYTGAAAAEFAPKSASESEIAIVAFLFIMPP